MCLCSTGISHPQRRGFEISEVNTFYFGLSAALPPPSPRGAGGGVDTCGAGAGAGVETCGAGGAGGGAETRGAGADGVAGACCLGAGAGAGCGTTGAVGFGCFGTMTGAGCSRTAGTGCFGAVTGAGGRPTGAGGWPTGAEGARWPTEGCRGTSAGRPSRGCTFPVPAGVAGAGATGCAVSSRRSILTVPGGSAASSRFGTRSWISSLVNTLWPRCASMRGTCSPPS